MEEVQREKNLMKFVLQTVHKMSACPKVIDISKRKPGTDPVSMVTNPQQQLVRNTANLTVLEKKTQEVWFKIGQNILY
jgi:hypothetical protein